MSFPLIYRDVEAVLASLLGVAPADMNAFQSRLKLMRRLGVPDMAGLKPGPRPHYDVRHLLQLTIANDLMGQGLSATAACWIVREFWASEWQEAVAQVIVDLATPDVPTEGDEGEAAVIAVIHNPVLDRGRQRVGGQVGPLPDNATSDPSMPDLRVVLSTEISITNLMQARSSIPTSLGYHRATLINLSQLFSSLVRELLERSLVTPEELVRALEADS